MRLKEILGRLSESSGLADIPVKGISDDSRSLRKGDLFFIIRRENFDIFSVLPGMGRKTCAFVADTRDRENLRRLALKKPVIYVRSVEKEFLKAVDLFYGFNKNNLKFIGVTGTNGKTTTTHLIYHILKSMRESASLIGTVKYCIGSKTTRAEYTTPGFLALRRILHKLKSEDDHFVVMEVSSHAINQGRIEGLDFLRCAFTNLSRDHLDYHKTTQNYFAAKRQLFRDNRQSISLINTDDNYGRKIFRELKRALSYGFNLKADFRAENVYLHGQGSRFDVVNRNKAFKVETSLCGRHNILNILAALGVVSSLEFPLAQAVECIPSFFGVEGRLEPVEKDIFVDYAHTPDALKNVLLSLRQIGYDDIICVFGCGGDRDRGKRKQMGSIAGKLANFTFITSDNPRSEDPLGICRQIKSGFYKKNYFIAVDRREAIREAVGYYRKRCRRNAGKVALLIAGKGHEDCQIIGDKRIPFKDSAVVREITGTVLNPKERTVD